MGNDNAGIVRSCIPGTRYPLSRMYPELYAYNMEEHDEEYDKNGRRRIRAFKCDFCGSLFPSLPEAQRHEQRCPKRPPALKEATSTALSPRSPKVLLTTSTSPGSPKALSSSSMSPRSPKSPISVASWRDLDSDISDEDDTVERDKRPKDVRALDRPTDLIGQLQKAKQEVAMWKAAFEEKDAAFSITEKACLELLRQQEARETEVQEWQKKVMEHRGQEHEAWKRDLSSSQAAFDAELSAKAAEVTELRRRLVELCEQIGETEKTNEMLHAKLNACSCPASVEN